MSRKTIQKNLRFSPSVVAVLEREGEKLGYNFNQFANYIITKAAENFMSKPLLDLDLMMEIIESEKLSEMGKLPKASNDKEIEDYINSVMNEDE